MLAPESCTPTHIQFVDIAGLVRGASQGEGLGNKFLGHIREADALVHVVRCFEDEQVAHVDGRIDPVGDVEIVETELMLADLEAAETAKGQLEKTLRADPKGPERVKYDLTIRILEGLGEEVPVRSLGLNADEWRHIESYHFLTGKAVLYLANVGEEDLPGGGPAVQTLQDRFGADRVLAVSAQIESEMMELPEDDRVVFLEEMGLAEIGLDRLIAEGYKLLNLITFYTVANHKLRAWQLEKQTGAPRAAGKIHSDMETGFIRAEVVAYKDLMDSQGMDGVRGLGKLRTEGKDYLVQDGDVVQFLFKA
jgi:GTP-binding protein YchF